MRTSIVWLLGCLVLPLPVVSGQEFPAASPPQVVVARITNPDRALEMSFQIVRLVEEQRTRVITENVVIDGKPRQVLVQRPYSVTREVYATTTQMIPLGNYRICDLAGEPLEATEVETMFALKSAVALALPEGQRLAPFFGDLYRRDLPVIYWKTEQPPAPAVP